MGESDEDKIALFVSMGLSKEKAKETLKNENLSRNFETLISYVKCHGRPPLDGEKKENVGKLLYHVASKMKPQSFGIHSQLIGDYIIEGKLDNEIRVNAALEYLLSHVSSSSQEMNLQDFQENCGVGVIVTPEEIEKEVEIAIEGIKEELLSKRYRFNTGLIMAPIRNKLKWADGKAIKAEVELQILDILGPKTEQDLKPPPKKEKGQKPPKTGYKDQDNKKKNGEKSGDENSGEVLTIEEYMRTKVKFHKPGENYKTDGWIMAPGAMERLEEHVKRTGGQVRTRFPPEPNGILHIGHSKAININFGYAAANDGVCFLRYDDTNPEKEEEKFFTGIKDIIEWLGFKPYKITHSSDYFQQLYEWAVDLIKKKLAYVCHQKVEDIRGFNPPPSPWRDRPSSESLQLFEDMKHGKFEEGEATLRLKITLEEGKQDPVAYRIKYATHHRSGDQWCIYPTYDYTHCLCDSIEDITHSMCTKEFQNRRSSYYWLCNNVEAYCPVQWEYGRLNVGYAVVSKRKIGKLITTGICKDWDDPRLFTLTALRRRGFPPEAINSFIAKIGVTGAQMTIDPSMIEASARNYLNKHAPRTMVVLEPLKVVIKNYDPKSFPKELEVPLFPDDPSKGTKKIPFSRTIYIEQSDFKSENEKGYRRLAPGQDVGLRYANVLITFITKKSDNEIEVEATPFDQSKSKPKAFIHWVAEQGSLKVEVRLYERLFKHSNPEDPEVVPGGFLSDINENSLKVLNDSIADVSLKNSKKFDKFQFERNGFFSVDPDTNKSKMVFNRTVSLKEDSGK